MRAGKRDRPESWGPRSAVRSACFAADPTLHRQIWPILAGDSCVRNLVETVGSTGAKHTLKTVSQSRLRRIEGAMVRTVLRT